MRRPALPHLHERLAVAFLIAAAVLAGCHGRDRAPARGGASSAPRCQALESLPGSVAMPPGLRRAIAAANVPSQALPSDRRVCNRLVLEPGAFARQHALDSIDWRPWSPQVLEEATSLGRPVFVFSGFSACASCRDLARRALRRRRLVRSLNKHFVPVLVDREQSPDVDAYVMQAAEVLTGGAGWPVIAFLQADGRPFEAYSWGAVGSGDKKLGRIVKEIQRRISLGGGTIEERAEAAAEKMQKRATTDTGGPLPDEAVVVDALRGYLVRSYDADAGTFGDPPLFPRAPVYDFLLRLHAARADAEALDMATTSLAGLRESPLADVVGGGFHRYARQSAWQEPAWEKMLADNAAMASVYLDAAAATDRADFRDTARATLDFLLRDLLLGNGAFAASLDAMGVDDDGNFCDGCSYAESDDVRRDALELPEARDRALGERATRPAPARDERVLADANALAISALVRGSSVLGQPRYREAAVTAAGFLDRTLRDGGRVNHCAYADGRRCSDGYLPDQALVALAFLDLDAGAAAGDSRWLETARAIADELPKRFEHEGTGGFFLTGVDAPPLPLRYKSALDTVVPSGNSAAAMLYVRLAARTGEARYAAAARRTLEAFSQALTLRPLALPSMVVALMDWSRLPPQVTAAPHGP